MGQSRWELATNNDILQASDSALRSQLAAPAVAVFDTADRNKDGVLTKSEIKAYLKNNMQLKGQLMQDKGYKELFEGLDTDRDSKVSRAEWTMYYVSKYLKARPLICLVCPHVKSLSGASQLLVGALFSSSQSKPQG